MDPTKTAQVTHDTTSIEGFVQENNPRYLNAIIKKLKYSSRFFDNSEPFNPYKTTYCQMPPHSHVNPEFSQQYINDKFCYALRCGVLSNGFGMLVALEFFDEEFKDHHPEIVVEKKTDSPDDDKSVGDARTLAPVLHQYSKCHPDAPLHTFLEDAAFDTSNCYGLLFNELNFKCALIPLNNRSAGNLSALSFNESGQPSCPKDPDLPMKYEGVLRENFGLVRQKWVCPKMIWKDKKQVCQCSDSCTGKSSGRMFYTHNLKHLRLFPGILRDSDKWQTLYTHRARIERIIGHMKVTLNTGGRMTQNIRSIKSDACFSAISVLMTVILAKDLHNHVKVGSVRSMLDLIA